MRFCFAFEVPGGTGEPSRGRRIYILRVFDSPRLPRQVLEQFRARVKANGGNVIDVLCQMMRDYGKETTGMTDRSRQ
jgi:hypothetical protein